MNGKSRKTPAAGSATGDRLPSRPSHEYRVGPAFAGERLDRFLQRMIPKLSRNRVQKAIDTRIRLSWDAPLKPSTPVVAGGIVYAFDLALADPETDARLPVLMEDRDLLAIDKPAGLVVHPTHGHNRNTVITLLRKRRNEPGLTLAHRLDAETSGVLLLGRHRRAARRLQLAFERGRVEKLYEAIVFGHPPSEGLVIDEPLGTFSRDGIIFRQSSQAEQRKPARTRVRPISRAGRLAHVSIEIETGRRHQIRAHLAEAGFPVVGDKLYVLDDRAYRRFLTSGGLDDDAMETLLAPRAMLHSRALSIPHPQSPDRPVRIEAPLPEDFVGLLREHARESGL